MSLSFDNSYARLPERFYRQTAPEGAPRPGLIRTNLGLAEMLGIDTDWLASNDALQVFAGNLIPEGAAAIATVYAGHQFGGFNPQLGDGRALLLGELISPDGKRFDMQLKGSGRTPYSRGGDGRSPLGPVLREYIVSEAMFALGVPTTRSLAAATTGAAVFRQKAHPGAVLTRIASSHIRVGTFEFFAGRQDTEGLRMLVEHVLARHYPEIQSRKEPALALREGVIARQAKLIAQWQLLGFIHGVMNTDNSLVSGETIDYGPCAFMDDFDPNKVFSSIDQNGRYAYANQPHIGAWNAKALAQALLPLFSDEQITRVQGLLDDFGSQFQEAFEGGLRAKLGLQQSCEGDKELMGDFWQELKQASCDFTLSFRRLADLAHPESSRETQVGDIFEFPDSFAPWLDRWQQRLSLEQSSAASRQSEMYRHNPALIARNHLVQAAIVAAEDEQHFCPFHDLVDALENPYDYRPKLRPFALPPRPEELVTQTFCGT